MGMMTGLALLGGAAIGALAARGRGKKPPTAPGPTLETPAEAVEATGPPSAVQAESANTAAARAVAIRTRRRAAQGSAGKVGAGVGAMGGKPPVTGAPRSLLGY